MSASHSDRSGGIAAACLLLALACAWVPGAVKAHSDLQLQIEAVTRQIQAAPKNPDLYLHRGDLLRRHQDWRGASEDFAAARALAPARTEIDWFEGRMSVDAGEYADGLALLSRYLESHPAHAGALQARARAHWALRNPSSAASNLQRAINASDRPAPVLYRSLVITQLAMGPTGAELARKTVDAGLARFPLEVSLLGLGVELAVLNSDPGRARAYLEKLPAAVAGLDQWRYRAALVTCVDGNEEEAAAQFRALIPAASEPLRPGTWRAPPGVLQVLAKQAGAGACRAAAMQGLASRQP